MEVVFDNVIWRDLRISILSRGLSIVVNIHLPYNKYIESVYLLVFSLFIDRRYILKGILRIYYYLFIYLLINYFVIEESFRQRPAII